MLHCVKVGETISSLAYDFGMTVETIWSDPKNAELRSHRGIWDKISPGDNIHIRKLEKKIEDVDTEQAHRFKKKIKYGLTIRIDLDPEENASNSDLFILKCVDGSYNIEKTLDDDLVPGDRFIDLHYSGLKRKKRYTLEIKPGEEGSIYTAFENIPYDDLANLYTAEGTAFEQVDVNPDDDDDDEPFPDEPDQE